MKPVEVEIFGRRFSLRSDKPTETIQLANAISQQVNELYEKYEHLDFSRLLLLAAFEREEKLRDLIKENEELRSELDRVNQMIEKIMNM
ncbi:MAG: cell division protein ZapA [Candidatus Cloacimonetes bacterium]|jgi:cell division protein ZapA (FtsZ GTPase activity inhibitor)|nr:cell division protein ZapA [Candidatus Cloacimonadota bacterium]NLO44419.1 cell division protein ZapA [Candidatus Cloacimonadota bacterium]